MGFTITEAYIINTMYVCEINFQGIYFRELKGKSSKYITATLSIVPVGSSSQDSLFSPQQTASYIGSVEKKQINVKEDEKIKFYPKIICVKIVWLSLCDYHSDWIKEIYYFFQWKWKTNINVGLSGCQIIATLPYGSYNLC